jgi:hypothetical protein
MLSTSPDAPKATIAVKFQRLASTAELIADRQTLQFLAACRNAFPELLTAANADSGHDEDS